MFKKINKKGFTLAELLIVVAIIGVLVAISIPIFTAQLNKAKYAADEANARSIYAELVADYLSSGGKAQGTDNTTISLDKTSISVGGGDTVTTTSPSGTKNAYKFSGIVKIDFHYGTAAQEPYVSIDECSAAGASAVTFGDAPTSTPAGD